MTHTIDTQEKEIVRLFSQAVRDKELEVISSLLSPDGVFDTQDRELATVQADRDTYLAWFSSLLKKAVIHSVDYDTCIHCRMGNPVVLFNDGQFPRRIKDDSEKAMTGLMLEIDNGLITGISFCYSFAHRENCYQFERYGPLVDDLVSQGIPLREACRIVTEQHGKHRQ